MRDAATAEIMVSFRIVCAALVLLARFHFA
jgi:hypothetical protein